MKATIIIMLALFIGHASFAQKRPEVKKMNRAESIEAVKKMSTFKYVEDMKAKGKDIQKDPVVRDRLVQAIELVLKDAVALEAGSSLKLVKLINVDPATTMGELVRLNSVIKGTDSTSAEKASAAKALQIIVKASDQVKSLTLNEADAQNQKKTLNEIIEVAEKSGLQEALSPAFNKALEKALTEGKSLEVAVKEAFKAIGKKHTLKELLECA